jgi:hypothetical protein
MMSGWVLGSDALRDIDLGAPAAERDIEHGLKQYFVESDAYRRVASRKKTVILGNRGSGKSAIFQIMAAREKLKKTIIVELAPEDYSYELLQTSLAAESQGSWAKLGAYSAAWKYLIYVLIMKDIVRSAGGKPGRKAVSKLSPNIFETTMVLMMSANCLP